MQALHTISRFAGIAAAALMLTLSPAHAEENMSKVAPPVDMFDLLDGDHTLGNETAPVTIIEYASLSCPHCMQYHLETFPQLKEKYIDTGKVVFVYRHFPFNDPALRGAMLAECSGDEDFFKYLNVMFKTQDKWAYSPQYMDSLRNLAKVGGMGEDAFDACMENQAVQERLVAGMTWAAEKMGVESTPTTFINGEKLSGFRTFDELAAKIEPLLKEAAKKPAE